jgi:hypothetical protein
MCPRNLTHQQTSIYNNCLFGEIWAQRSVVNAGFGNWCFSRVKCLCYWLRRTIFYITIINSQLVGRWLLLSPIVFKILALNSCLKSQHCGQSFHVIKIGDMLSVIQSHLFPSERYDDMHVYYLFIVRFENYFFYPDIRTTCLKAHKRCRGSFLALSSSASQMRSSSARISILMNFGKALK